MRRALLLTALAPFMLLTAASKFNQLAQVQTIYILPMGSGMDQFLADRLTRSGGFQIVTDPQKADAIATEKLGDSFERRLDQLYPPTMIPLVDVEADDNKDDEAAARRNIEKENSLRPTSFGRGKGTIFLVDRKSRNVLWSVYARPKNSSPDELDRTAERITTRLNHDRKRSMQP